MPHHSIESIKKLLATNKIAEAIEAMLQTSFKKKYFLLKNKQVYAGNPYILANLYGFPA